MYIFISIIFIAELIIAFSIINLIIKADRKICDINACIVEFNPLAQTCMQYVRCISSSFCGGVKSGIDFIKKQRERFVVRTVSTVAIHVMLFIFRIKKIRANKMLKLISAIGDVAADLAI